MKTFLVVNFKSGDGIKFSFDLNEGNLSEITGSVVRNFEKKILLLQSKAASNISAKVGIESPASLA
ncbi:MAG: hypothetical protein IPP05_21915 [Cytophagaceae bacterium]|nr:hypothetical protein [Cytophagaceae bacterium]